MTDIPQWAIDRAAALWLAEPSRCKNPAEAFARYISQHEEPPADPLMNEARRIAADIGEGRGYHAYWREECVDGKHDQNEYVIAALAGLRRGIEIAALSKAAQP